MSQFPLVPWKSKYPLTILGMAWRQDAAGRWERHLLRQYADGTIQHSPLTLVLRFKDGTTDFCMRCLHQRLYVAFIDGEVWYECPACPPDAHGQPRSFTILPDDFER